jgi:hypothetical protein
MTIEEINARLKAAKIGVSVECRGDRLSLRGTFPPKTRLGETKPKQRSIPLKIYANPAGLRRAKAEALKVGGQLAGNEFDWDQWEDEPEADKETISNWVDRFESDYFNRRSRTPKSETTWRIDYAQPFNQLPFDALLTADVLRQSILETKPDTRNRQRRCMSLGMLAKFAGVELKAMALGGE